MIDYVCMPLHVTDCIAYAEIVDDDCLNVSRHRPVIAHLSIPNFEIYNKGATEQASVTHRINWDNVTNHQRSDYRAKVANIGACTYTHTVLNNSDIDQWIVPQFLNLRPKMAKSIVYVITLITNRNHAFHCLN